VFVARDVTLGRAVALKVLQPHADGGEHERLLREAQALAKLSHPNVVTVHEVGEADGKVFIAMELLEGPTLREWMQTDHSWREVVTRFLAAGRGFAAVQAIGRVERDFNPSNVLFDRSGVVKLGYLGVVAAPEEARGEGAERSFCVALSEALARRRLPRRLRALLTRGLAMDALLAELERALRPAARIRISVVAAIVALVGGAAVARFVWVAPSVTKRDALAPAARAEADRLAAEIARLEKQLHDGNYEGLTRQATDAVARARALGHAPTLLAALNVLANVQHASEDRVAAAATCREITQLAAAAHEDEQAANAWVLLVATTGKDLLKPDEARGILAAAEAAVARAGSSFDLRVKLLINSAQLDYATGKGNEALARLDEAQRLVIEAGKDRRASKRVPELGDIAQAVRIRRLRVGECPALAISMVALASALRSANELDEYFSVLEQAARMARAKIPPEDPTQAVVLIELANAHRQRKQWSEAGAIEDEAIGLLERAGVKSRNLPRTLFNRGQTAIKEGRWTAALEYFDRSIAEFEAQQGPDFHELARPLAAKGRTLVEHRRAAEALAPLARALALSVPEQSRDALAEARFYHGRAVVESGGDRDAGLAEARVGREEVAAFEEPEDVKAADAWLAKQRRSRP
jgi:tetratricopeptide (TPR) repeat protein